jgi:hypothetical protein
MTRTNLDHLMRDILAHLDHEGFVPFKSQPRGPDLGNAAVYWDTERYPDYREFLTAAASAGARLITVWSREFSPGLVDDAMASLSEANLPRDERREIERRLKEFRSYEGFVCQIELSFAHDQRTYIFDQPTDWFEELEQMLDQLDDSLEGSQDENPLGGFYSHN